MVDPFNILGIPKTASAEDVARAFRGKAKECHPDLFPNNKTKEEQFKRLNNAQEEALSLVQKRDQGEPDWIHIPIDTDDTEQRFQENRRQRTQNQAPNESRNNHKPAGPLITTAELHIRVSKEQLKKADYRLIILVPGNKAVTIQLPPTNRSGRKFQIRTKNGNFVLVVRLTA